MDIGLRSLRVVSVDHARQMARGIIVLDRPTLIAEIRLGTLSDGTPAIPRLRIMIDGRVAAESYWEGGTDPARVGSSRYVYPGERGSSPLLLPAGPIEFRVQARERAEVTVPLEEQPPDDWTYEWTDNGGMTWQPLEGALPIALHKL